MAIFSTLPVEITAQILSYVPWSSLHSAASVCHLWRDIILDDVFIDRYSNLYEDPPNNTTIYYTVLISGVYSGEFKVEFRCLEPENGSLPLHIALSKFQHALCTDGRSYLCGNKWCHRTLQDVKLHRRDDVRKTTPNYQQAGIQTSTLEGPYDITISCMAAQFKLKKYLDDAICWQDGSERSPTPSSKRTNLNFRIYYSFRSRNSTEYGESYGYLPVDLIATGVKGEEVKAMRVRDVFRPMGKFIRDLAFNRKLRCSNCIS